MNIMNMPGFTATSSLGKSNVSYRQFCSMNFRRSSSPIEPQLMISDPFRVLFLLDGGGFWGGSGRGGIDWDVPMPLDIGSSGDSRVDRACQKCRSNCRGNTRCLRRCVEDVC